MIAPRIAYSLALAAVAVLPLSSATAQKQAAPKKQASSQTAAARGPAKWAPEHVAMPSGFVSDPSWFYKGSDLPQDPDWKFGTLPNGLRYAVRKNGVPPGQLSIRVRIDAGSLYETESERGFAHLIEHLSFRGSKYVPDGEAKRVWQRLGVTFGSDTNAQTTPTQTVFKLDLPSATPAGLDESMKILAGMVSEPAIVPDALNAERPVVLAEQREQPGPDLRYSDLMRQTLFAGQPLADRSPIGNVKTLEAATAESVRAFHDHWYRPERVVVIISGDMDTDILAKAIADRFSDWHGVGPAPADPDFGEPRAGEPATASLVEPSIPPTVTYGVIRAWHFNNDTFEFNQKRMVDLLATRILNRRLETKARGGASYLQASISLDDVSRSINGTFVNVIPATDDWAGALKDVRTEIARIQSVPPTQAEIDREVTDFMSSLKADVESARAEAGSKETDDMVQALDIRETVVAPDGNVQVIQGAIDKGMFTPATIQASARQIFTGAATRAIVSTRTAQEGVQAKLAQALTADVAAAANDNGPARTVTFADLPKLGQPGKIASREAIPGLDVEKLVFANGVRAMVSSSTTEAGRVYVRVRFGGGLRQLPRNRDVPSWAGNSALVASGIGKLGQDDIEQLVNGRRMGMDFSTDDDAFSFSALTSAADLPDQLKLIATKLAKPGWDPRPVNRARAVMLAGYPSLTASPNSVMARDLEALLHAGDPRWGTPTLAEIQALTPKKFRKLWAPILASGPIEVQVFGDVTVDKAVEAIAGSFGALKHRKAAKMPDTPVPFPAHVATPVIRTHEGADSQAAAVIAWPTGGGMDGVETSRRLQVLAAIFGDRMFDKLRSAEGASYSPSVQSDWPLGMSSGGRMIAIGQVPPDRVDNFFRVARSIAADLVANPVSADELERTLLPIQQQIARYSTANAFWMVMMTNGTYDPRRLSALQGMIGDYRSITPEQLRDVAAKYLRPETDWTMAVVPAAATAGAVAK